LIRVDSVVACQIVSASQLSMGEGGPFRDANALRAAIDSEHGVGVLSRQQLEGLRRRFIPYRFGRFVY